MYSTRKPCLATSYYPQKIFEYASVKSIAFRIFPEFYQDK